MYKYFRSFLLSISVFLQYKADIFSWFLVGCLNIGALLVVWLNVLGNKQQVGGFTRSDFIIYYFFYTVGWYVVAGWYASELGLDIKNGVINTTLLKPYNKVVERFLREQAWKVVALVLITPVSLVVLYLLRDQIQLTVTFPQVVFFIISLIFATAIFAIFQAILGCLAFWIDELWPILDLYWMAAPVFGGNFAPLQFMPHWVQLVATLLPFKYIFYIPITIFLGKELYPLQMIVVQIIYTGLLFVLLQLVWRAGIKKYEAYGG